MRLAHLILAYDNPIQLERLVMRLITNQSDVYIHLDAKTAIAPFKHLAALKNVFFIQRRTNIQWGSYSMVEAELRSFKQILQTNIQYSHINLISGQDYPLRDIYEIQDFLFANSNKSYMRYKSIFEEWPESIRRLTKYHLGDYRFPLHYKVQAILNKIMPDRKLPKKMIPYGFSQWMTITPAAAEWVLTYLQKNKKVNRFFKMTFCADELVFQTLLLNSPLKDSIVNDHLRLIKFDTGVYRPRILTIAEAGLLENSGKFFARKFSIEKDVEILDYLDTISKQKQ